MAKEIFASKALLGCQVSEQPFFLSEFRQEENFKINGTVLKGYVLTLQDRTGEIKAFLPAEKWKKEHTAMICKVVNVWGIVLVNDAPYIKLESLEIANEFEPRYFILGLTDKKKKLFVDLLYKQIAEVQDPELKGLLNAVFTPETISKMADYPASLKTYGNYHGGLLVSTTNIVYLVRKCKEIYNLCANGLYTGHIDTCDYDLLLTAALLHGIGRLREYTPFPHKKSVEGKKLGSVALLQKSLYDICKASGVELSSDKEMSLMSIIIPAIDQKSQVKPVSKEAIFLKQAVEIYKACDERDKVASEYQGDEEVFFSPEINAYVQRKKEVAG